MNVTFPPNPGGGGKLEHLRPPTQTDKTTGLPQLLSANASGSVEIFAAFDRT